MIPKIIHYCWFGGKPLPRETRRYIRSWKQYCPDYQIIQWDETNFDVGCIPYVKSAYDAKRWAFVSDYARLKIVYDIGGIYLDTDVELIKNMDFLLRFKCYFGVQQNGNLCATGLGFGAEKNNFLVGELMKEYLDITFQEKNKDNLACPILNTRVLERYGYTCRKDMQIIHDNAAIFPPEYFDPWAPGKTSSLLCADTVSIHHYSASWTGWQNRLKRKLFRIIGEPNVYALKKILKREKNNSI